MIEHGRLTGEPEFLSIQAQDFIEESSNSRSLGSRQDS